MPYKIGQIFICPNQLTKQAYFNTMSSDTVSLCLPFALLAANTLLPFLEAILFLKPCLFTLLRRDG
jgi:hypothetical protein